MGNKDSTKKATNSRKTTVKLISRNKNLWDKQM